MINRCQYLVSCLQLNYSDWYQMLLHDKINGFYTTSGFHKYLYRSINQNIFLTSEQCQLQDYMYILAEIRKKVFCVISAYRPFCTRYAKCMVLFYELFCIKSARLTNAQLSIVTLTLSILVYVRGYNCKFYTCFITLHHVRRKSFIR